MNYHIILEDIYHSLKAGEAVFLLGAGISMNSGLPNAKQTKKYVAQSLFQDIAQRSVRKDIRKIMTSMMPFEMFLQLVSHPLENIRWILDIYQKGEPNINHVFMSRLWRERYFDSIYTTNFDCLLEKAIGKEYTVHASEDSFSRRSQHQLNIYKLHGSIDEFDSIRATITSISNRKLADKRKNIIRKLFMTGKHKCVIILGYSFSDEFDINSVLKRISKGKKEIFYIHHTDSPQHKLENLRSHPCLYAFQGKILHINTDQFIEDLWCKFFTDKICRTNSQHYQIKQDICNWENNIKTKLENKLFIIGQLLYRNSAFSRAHYYFRCGYEHIKYTRKQKEKGEFLNWISNILQWMGKHHEALPYSKKALKIYESIEDRNGIGQCLISLANAYDSLGRYALAIQMYLRGIETFKQDENKAMLGYAYLNICNPYFNMGQYEKMIDYQKRSLSFLIEAGDKYNEAHGNINLGKAYWALGNFTKAMKYMEFAKNIFQMLDDRQGKANVLMNIGILYFEQKSLEKHMKYQKEAIKIFTEIVDPLGIANCNQNLGEGYYKMGHLKKAFEYLFKAKRGFEELFDHAGVGCTCRLIGDLFEKSGDFRNAKEFWQQALTCFKKTKQEHEIMQTKKRLARIICRNESLKQCAT